MGKNPDQKIIILWLWGMVLSLMLVLGPFSLHAAGEPAEGNANPQKLMETLKREAYYHFFLEEYLTAATRLKAIEASGEAANDAGVVNEARILLGSLYLAWGMDRSAIRVFGGLDDILPPGEKRNQLLLKVVKAQYERSRYQAALETSRLITPLGMADSIEQPRYSAQAQYLTGLNHYAAGSVQEGVKRLETISPMSPYFPYAQLTLAKSYVVLNQPARSLRLLRDLSEADTPGSTLLGAFAEKSRLTWGQLLIEEGEYGEARRVLARIPQESPFFPDALFGMAWTQFKEENDLDAILTFQDLIKMTPHHDEALEALTILGHGYKRLGASQTALDHYAKAIEVYRQKVAEVRSFQEMFEDPGAFSSLLAEYESGEGPLVEFLKDDRIRFWVRRYGDLLKLESHLDHNIRNMDVFEVLVDHKEKVFREYVPVVRRFLTENPLKGLRKKGEGLRTDVDLAVHEEKIPSLASEEEEKIYGLLSRAVLKSRDLGAVIKALDGASAQVLEQRKAWQGADRALKIALGNLVWKISSEVPGRADNLQRSVRRVMADLESIEKNHVGLIASIPALENEIARFRKRIKSARAELLALREKTLSLRASLLPPLQAVFLGASETWINQIVRLVAVAELSQIQILDGKNAGKGS